MKKLVTVFLAAVAVVLVVGTGPAQAHSSLIGSTPASDATLAGAPDSIELQFNQSINTAFATVTLTDRDGVQRGDSEAMVDGARVRLAIPEPLAAGSYTVAYRVISADGHPITGSYGFAVTSGAGPAPSSAAPPTPSPSSNVAESETTETQADPANPEPSGSSIPLLMVLAAVVVLIIAGGTWVAARALRKR